jgi:cytoskeletal protein CcmA (bactofilin family)
MSPTVIAAHTRIEGSVTAEGDLVVEGTIVGDVRTTGSVRLLATAEVKGDLEAARVAIEDGAVFEGQVRLRRVPARQAVVEPRAEAPRAVPELSVPGRRRAQRRAP